MTWEGLNPPYRTIVADPPWAKWYRGPGAKGNPGDRYSTMDTPDICSMPVGMLAAEDALLWVWGVNGILDHAFDVARAWGFAPRNVLTWCKSQPGTGAFVRSNTEHCLLAQRGRPVVPTEPLLASWFIAKRTTHSTKPASFFDMVERVSPGPYVELFARQPRLGWDAWGHGYESESA